jgi:putative ABC transport system substrate-binding protein
MRVEGSAGVVVASTQQLSLEAARFGPAAESLGLPPRCEWDYMAHSGCVMAYGHDLEFARGRIAEYTSRILKGAVPADLPVEQLDVWKLTVNTRDAAHMGLIVPASILARADDVVD